MGSKSTHLTTGVFNLNQVDSKYLSLGNLLTQPIDDPAVKAAGFAPPYPGFTGSLAQALRPFPQYSGIGNTNSANMGNATYHSLQMKLEKQFSNGLFLLSSYTWSKTLTDASSTIGGFSTSARDQYNRAEALAFSDVPSRLVVAFNYELPIGPKPHATSQVAGKILGAGKSMEYGLPVGNTRGGVTTICRCLTIAIAQRCPGVNPKFDTSNFDPAKDLSQRRGLCRTAPFTRKCPRSPT